MFKQIFNMTQIISILKRWRLIFFAIFFFLCLVQVYISLKGESPLFQRFEVDPSLDLITFQSTITPFAMLYPQGWQAQNVLYGNHGDLEVIGLIRSHKFNSPIIEIAHKKNWQSNLEQVAEWGKTRLITKSDGVWLSTPLTEKHINKQIALFRIFYQESGLYPLCYHTYLFKGQDAYTVQMCMNKNNRSTELEDLFTQMIQSITY